MKGAEHIGELIALRQELLKVAAIETGVSMGSRQGKFQLTYKLESRWSELQHLLDQEAWLLYRELRRQLAPEVR